MVGDILQPTHLLFVLVVALLVLGPKRLPEVGRALGDGLRDFRSAISGENDDRHKETGNVLTYDEHEPAEKHEFAHEEPETPQKLAFSSAQSDAENAFGRDSSDLPAGHEFAHDSSEPGDKHEFAYESTEPGNKPAEPPA
jgi:sec-independent protein translocase protein TatA